MNCDNDLPALIQLFRSTEVVTAIQIQCARALDRRKESIDV